jgi:hypothetical protein
MASQGEKASGKGLAGFWTSIMMNRLTKLNPVKLFLLFLNRKKHPNTT